jgi:hypothetical protein
LVSSGSVLIPPAIDPGPFRDDNDPMRTLPLIALLFLLVLPAAQCDRRPGDCLADELGKRRATHSTWLTACERHLWVEAGDSYAACKDEWFQCRALPKADWADVPRNPCCIDDVLVASYEQCDLVNPGTQPLACVLAFGCDTEFDRCLRGIDLEWHHYTNGSPY